VALSENHEIEAEQPGSLHPHPDCSGCSTLVALPIRILAPDPLILSSFAFSVGPIHLPISQAPWLAGGVVLPARNIARPRQSGVRLGSQVAVGSGLPLRRDEAAAMPVERVITP
jgi:hypothetical protein